VAEPADNPAQPPEEILADVRPLPVLAERPSLELDRPRPVSVPATVVAATGGFILGVTAFVLVKVLRRPRAARAVARRRRRGAQKGLDIAATRSFLVDVHLLDRR
jgi:hypothetical protein